MSGSWVGRSQDAVAERILTLELDTFGWEAITEESARQGVSVEDLISFSVMYYLADVDSGRVSRRITRSPYPRPRGYPESTG